MKILKRIWNWIDDRSGISESVGKVMHHLVPPGSKWSYVFGSATLFCLVLQVVTGVALSLMYQPSSSEAYQSLDFITNHAVLGNVLRGIHYFGASAMIILVGIHMTRVYIMAAYKYPREMSWISGILLLLLTVAMGFTGQLLRWDSNGVWSSVVAAEQLSKVPWIGHWIAHLLIGGKTIGGQTLSRFYSYHVFIIPALLFLLIGFHIFLVVRNGISEPPKVGRLIDPKTYRQWYKDMLKREGLPFWPYSAWRDVVFSALVIIGIVVIAVVVGPPSLTSPPDPSMIHTVPRPDWYMNWIFALFALMPPKIESYIIFIAPVTVIFILLALPFFSNKGERSPLRRPWAVFGTICVITFVISLLIIGGKSPWSPDFSTKPIPAKVIASSDTVVNHGAALFYQKGCLYCHQIGNVGGQKGPDLSDVARRLSGQEMTVKIVNGGMNMPAFGGILSKEQLSDIIKFLSTRK